jgi:hypothetical protein
MNQADDPRLPNDVALPRPLHRRAERALRTPLRRAVALGSVAVLLASGVAGASIPAADGTTLGCYDTNSGKLRAIDASGAACTTTFTLVPPDPAAAGAGRRAVEYGIRTDRGLSTQGRSQLMAWLNGDPLLDPRLAAWVDAVTMGHPVEGAGPMAQGSAALSCR